MFEPMRVTPYNSLAVQFMFPIGGAFRRAALSQTSIRQAAIACALERYRLVHGEFPGALSALVPQFVAKLPQDVINGQPLHYRRIERGNFLLYSVGWNETDEGGKIVLTDENPPHQDLDHGDWVWSSQPQPSARERK